ncbi:HN1_G0037160.mRNA.1.CDS.1 [Saccharomyces cerevisiae]|nr:HN1_G0037160.mRNA.1.CDS.1 [Saccharomyces cerevisiae]
MPFYGFLYPCGKPLEYWVNNLIIVVIPLLVKAIILCIQIIIEIFLEDIGIFEKESIFLHTNITTISHSVLYISLSYYIISPCISLQSI